MAERLILEGKNASAVTFSSTLYGTSNETGQLSGFALTTDTVTSGTFASNFTTVVWHAATSTIRFADNAISLAVCATATVPTSTLVFDAGTNIVKNFATYYFKTITPTSGTAVVANAYDDTVTFTAGSGVTITGAGDAITWALAAGVPTALGNPTLAVDGTAVAGSGTTAQYNNSSPALANPFTPASGTQTITGNVITSGNLTVNGNATFGDASGDSFTVRSNAPIFENVASLADATGFAVFNSVNRLERETTIPFAATFSAEADFTAGIEVETIQNLAGNNAITIAAGATPTVTVPNNLNVGENLAVDGTAVVEADTDSDFVVTARNITGGTSASGALNVSYTSATAGKAVAIDSADHTVSIGDMDNGYALFVQAGDLAVNGNTTLGNSGSADTATINAQVILTPGTAQNITAAATAITLSGPIIQLTANASYTLSATPTIANGTNGQVITIINVDSADVITLQNETTLAGSNLRLAGAANLALGPRDSVTLVYSSTLGDWIQIGASNN